MKTDDPTTDSEFSDLRADVAVAKNALTVAVKTACPGVHHVEQHRDMKPPWCPVCGRDDLGILRHSTTGPEGASA